MQTNRSPPTDEHPASLRVGAPLPKQTGLDIVLVTMEQLHSNVVVNTVSRTNPKHSPIQDTVKIFDSVLAQVCTVHQALVSVILKTCLSTSMLSKISFHQKQPFTLETEKAFIIPLQRAALAAWLNPGEYFITTPCSKPPPCMYTPPFPQQI